MTEKSQNGNWSETEKPLEYFIVAATNPYISNEERNKLTAILCEKIVHDLEGGAVAVKILSHKVLSPDQAESLNTLNIIDQCVRNCGQKVWNEVAKFRFLNQFVRLLSPKYMGLETSDAVRNRAVELLFTWKSSMRHLGKIDEVYNLLKEQGVIEHDPILIAEIPNCPKPSRLAFFEDEEKAQLLSELLKSKNPDDLQAANRLIKSMVRSVNWSVFQCPFSIERFWQEDLRAERMAKRRECMDKAEGSCRVLTEMLDEFTVCSRSGNGVMKELFEDLLTVRPMIFRYAGEAAESDDEFLADVLSINDIVNKTIQRYKTMIQAEDEHGKNGLSQSASKSFDQCHNQLDLLGISNVLHRPTTSNSSYTEVDDDALIGLSLAPSPAVMRKTSEQKETRSSLDELLGSLVERAFSSKAAELSRPTDIALIAQNEIAVETRSSDPFSPTGNGDAAGCIDTKHSTLVQVSLELTDVSLDFKRTPLIIFDESNVKLVLYYSESGRLPSTIRPFIVSITNANCYDLEKICLTLISSSPNVESKLLSTKNGVLPAFNPLGVQKNISQVFLLYVGQSAKQKIMLSYALSYAVNGAQKNINGEFPFEI